MLNKKEDLEYRIEWATETFNMIGRRGVIDWICRNREAHAGGWVLMYYEIRRMKNELRYLNC